MVESTEELDQEDRTRADLYNLLATLLARAPDATALELVAGLDGGDSDLGAAVGRLVAEAAGTSPESVEREYHDLFIGLGRGELLPYASYYLTGFLHEKPLAVLRNDLAELGIRRADTVHEPEDHIASLCESMRWLILGDHVPGKDGGRGKPASVETQKTFYEKHIAPWAGHFFADLEAASSAVFYVPVGELGRRFLAIEEEAFRTVESAGLKDSHKPL